MRTQVVNDTGIHRANRELTKRWEAALLLGVGLFLAALVLAWDASDHRLDDVLDHGSDQWGYYQYLPAVLGTHDWNALPWAVELENGNRLSLFNSGVAWLQAPFFTMAWCVAKLTGADTDGYSEPFTYAQFAAAAFYLSLGCVLLFTALSRLVSHTVAIVVPLLLFAGTNLYFYSVHETGMSHVYAFFLMAWLVRGTLKMVGDPNPWTLTGLIACAGLLLLVRPLHAVALLFPLLYGSKPMDALRVRSTWLRGHPFAVLAGMGIALFVWIPQLLYWKTVTGHWLVFTYGKKGEGFDWLHPHLLDVLGSHQNGWFIYTPLMVAVMLVLVWQAWKARPNARLILSIWLLVWYLYASWWCWWLGGSFGHRGFIEYYALLALPLAWGLQHVATRTRVVQELVWIGLAILVYANIRMSRIYQWPWEGPDWTWSKLAANYLHALLGWSIGGGR